MIVIGGRSGDGDRGRTLFFFFCHVGGGRGSGIASTGGGSVGGIRMG